MSTRHQVQQALRAANVKFRASGRILSIFCPFHDDKKSASCAIYANESKPHFYCYGCGTHGYWEDLQKVLRLAELPRDWEDPLACRHLRQELSAIAQSDPKLPPLVRPWTQGNWRRLKQETLTQVNSQWWWDEMDKVRRIVFPIWDRTANLVGWSGRALDSSEEVPKYRHMTRMEIISEFWPLPKGRRGETTAVIVEGIVDALRLLQQGIPALANMGCNWSKARGACLLAMGISRVVVALDGDDAGRRGNDKILQNLKWQYSKSKLGVWEWPEGSDPGDAPIEEIRELRDLLGKSPGPHPWLSALPKLSSSWLVETQPQENYDEHYH